MRLIIALAAVLLSCGIACAQGKERQVRFPANRRSVTYSGHLVGTDWDYDAYVLSGKVGQRLTVALRSGDPGAHLILYSLERGPTDDQIAPGPAHNVRLIRWSGRLPETGKYSVQVYGKRRNAAYTLRIGIEG